MQRFYLRMVFSHNFRKLYTLLLLMAILVFSFVAYQVQPNEIGAHVMALLALLLFKFTPHLYTLGVMVGLLLVASIYYPSSKVIFKAQCPDSGRHLAQCPEDIVNFYF